MNITAYNFDTTDLEQATMSSRTNAGATVFKVRNSDRIAVGRKILVGEMSRERSEILEVANTTPTQITVVGPAKFNHDADDPIYLLDFDQVRFKRSISGPNGTYDILATVDIDVDNRNGTTRYNDPNSLDTYFYQFCFYDSVSDVESEPSGKLQGTGYEKTQIGRAILDVGKRLGDPDFIQTSIDTWLAICEEVNDDLVTRAKRPYTFLKKSRKIDIEEGDDAFPFPDDLWKINYVEVNVSNPASAEVYRPRKVELTDMKYRRSINPMPSDDVYEIAYDDEPNDEDDIETHRKVLFNPAARTARLGAFTLHYWRYPTEFKDMSSRIQTPTNMIYKMAMYKDYYAHKADDDSKYIAMAQNYDQKYEAEIMKLQREKQIDAHAPRSFGPQVRRYRQ